MAKLLTDFKSVVAKSGKLFKEVFAKSNSRSLWKSGAIVTYMVDTGVSYTVEVDSGASVLSPSFTPAKDGWTFVGWRKVTVASADTLENEVMGSEPIALFAVFTQDVNVTFKSQGKSEDKPTTLYYNNSNLATGSVVAPTGASYSGWTWRGWGTSDAADAAVAYANGAAVSNISKATTIYGLYSQNITVTYYDDNQTAKTMKGIKYYNASGNTLNPWFTFEQKAKSGWTTRGWGTSDAANATKVFEPKIDGYFDSNITIYGLYQQNITLSYDGNGADSGSVAAETKTRYYSSSGKYANPSFTLKANGFTKTDYEFTGWDLGTAGATVALDVNKTAKAQWKANAFYVVRNHSWVNSADANHGTNGWLHVEGVDSNWSTNQGMLANNNDFDGWGRFRGPSWDTKGLKNIRIKITTTEGVGTVSVNGTSFSNLMNLGAGTHEGTISSSSIYIDAGLNGGSYCYIEEIYIY